MKGNNEMQFVLFINISLDTFFNYAVSKLRAFENT